MLVSAVIPTYNRAALLGRAIRSVLTQSHPAIELIVVDDGSIDGTAQLVGEFNDPRVRFLAHPANAGVSCARNTGIRAASGQWVAFLDSDDEWLPRRIERQLERLGAADEPRLAVIYGAYFERHGFSGRSRVKPRRLLEGDFGDQLVDLCDVRISTVLARRDALLAVGGFRAALRCSEDTDLWLRLVLASYRFVAVPEPLAIVHRHLGAHLHADPRARAEAARVLDAEWGGLVRRHGRRAYRAWRKAIEPQHGYLEFLQVREVLLREGRVAAWRAWVRMARHAVIIPRWVTQAGVLIALGRRGYARLAAIRGALSSRAGCDDSRRPAQSGPP